MAIRWICPNCGGGVNAPTRPRMDDVRRYCLACSAKTGRLVQRTAPTLERRRAEAAQRSTAKAQRKRQAERAQYTVMLRDALGVERALDVKAELRSALSAMGFFNGWAYGHKPTITDIYMTIRRGEKGHHSGRAIESGFNVWFTFGKGGTYEDALRVIYHEAAHMASPPGTAHGSAFHRLLAEGLQKRWPWIVYGSTRANQPGGCWRVGRRITEQMEQYTREKGAPPGIA